MSRLIGALVIAGLTGCAGTPECRLPAAAAAAATPRRPVAVQVWMTVDGRASAPASLARRAAVLDAVMRTGRFAAVYPEALPAERALRVTIRLRRPTWRSWMRLQAILLGPAHVSYEDRFELHVSLADDGRRIYAEPTRFTLAARRGTAFVACEGRRFESYDEAFDAQLFEALARTLPDLLVRSEL